MAIAISITVVCRGDIDRGYSQQLPGKKVMVIIFWSILVLLTLLALGLVSVPFWKKSQKNFYIILLALPILAFGLYFYLGSSQSLLHYWALKKQAQAVKLALKKIHGPQQLIDRLQAHLKRHPNSARGWYLLGRIYMGERKWLQALAAMQKSYRLTPDNQEYFLAYAEASFFASHNRLPVTVRRLLKQFIKRKPKALAAINLLANDAYQRQNYASAASYWQRLLPLVPVGSGEQASLLKMIGKAQRRLKN